MKKLYVTTDIYIISQPTGFHPVGYRININDPQMNNLYRQYKENHKLPHNYPLTDAQRFAFEKAIFNMIDAGAIVVSGL